MTRALIIAVQIGMTLAPAATAQDNDVAEADRARVAAIHVGGDVGAFYSRDYLGVMASGAFEDWAGAATAVRPGGNPGFRLSVERVRLFGDVAVETGTQWLNERAVKFLRVWTKADGNWKVWAHHGIPVEPRGAASVGPTAPPVEKEIVPTGPTGDVIALNERQRGAQASGVGSSRISFERIHGYAELGVSQGTIWTHSEGVLSSPARFTRIWIRNRATWTVLEDYRTVVTVPR